jgi:hypothetical protein
MVACPPYAWSATLDTNSIAYASDISTVDIPPGADHYQVYFGTIALSDPTLTWAVFADIIAADGTILGTRANIASYVNTAGTLTTGVIGIPTGAAYFRFDALAQKHAGTGTQSFAATGTINWTGSCTATPFCEYGTQLQTGVKVTEVITLALIDLALSAASLPFLAIVFDALVGVTLNTGLLCAGNAPGIPLAFQTSSGGVYPTSPTPEDILQFFEAIAWPYFCQCTPATGGAPAPIAPPPFVPIAPPITGPGFPPPVALPSPPALVCTNEDICSTLTQIVTILNHLNNGLQIAITNINNISVAPTGPSGYVDGPTFGPLNDGGEFSAPATLVGLAVWVATVPSYASRDVADPVGVYKLGKISVGIPEGWQASTDLRHSPQWIQIPGGVTRVGYWFDPGLDGYIQLLLSHS